MSSIFWKSVSISPIFLGIILSLAPEVMAAPKSNVIANPATVTGSANDLILNKASGTRSVQIASGETAPATQPTTESNEVATDTIKPGDWQYTALQGVAAKYGCNSNLNNQPVSQLDFARSLNTCLVKIEPILAQQPSSAPSTIPNTAPGTAPTSVTAGDLEVIKRLTQEFRAQLTEVDGRITSADKKIAQAQASQFSTTTKLKGEAIFNVNGALSGSNSNNLAFGDRVRLLFETSFNGKDRLWTRLGTGNQSGVTGQLKNGPTGEGAQVSEFNVNNSFGLDWLAYQFPVGSTNVYVPAFNGIHVDYAPSYSPNFEDFTGGNGALSNFAESSPIYKIGGGAGAGTNIPISENGLKSISVGYLSGSANTPLAGKGLFNGDSALLGQLNFKLGDKLEAGLTYVNSYHTGTNPIYGFGAPAGAPGTPLGLTGTGIANTNVSGTSANSYGAEVSYKASDTLAFNGFALNTKANKDTIGKQDIWSYGAGLSLPNVDGKGSLIGLMIGAEPYVGGAGSTPLHFEGFYKYKFNDSFSVTPGLIYLTSPNQTSGNNALIGVVRTTFTF
jgi:Carbohydrate-selective porin, OprB family